MFEYQEDYIIDFVKRNNSLKDLKKAFHDAGMGDALLYNYKEHLSRLGYIISGGRVVSKKLVNEQNPRTRQEMSNRPTSYEIVISINGQHERVGFAQRSTERSLRKLMGSVMNDDREARMSSALSQDELHGDYTYDRRLGRIVFGQNVWFGKTGKTERDLSK